MSKTYTTAEAAKKAGVSRQTLHAWMNANVVAAPEPVKVGALQFRFWTETDIAKLKKFRGTLKRGPKGGKR
jgi:predicted DNA-binding transcriptional regulator AlpA